MAAVVSLVANANNFRYSFIGQPLAKVLSQIADDHPEVEINFIYNELETYLTSVSINTPDPYDALRRAIGSNPVNIVREGNTFYIEALQHGRYCYTGRAVGIDSEPVVAASVMLLAPNDSSVITYGITDDCGRFSIPCDHQGVIVRLSCIGYKPTLREAESFALGSITMDRLPVKLRAVAVAVKTQRIIDYGVEYIPTKMAKKAAIDAVQLLSFMNIPQLDIVPGCLTINTYTGQDVGVFIDSKSATVEDLQSIRTEDVTRIEVLQSPADPRYLNQMMVVNFVMRKLDWGGYSKITAGGRALAVDGTNGLLYSKFAHKKWTFDVNAVGRAMRDSKYSNYNVETFRDINIADNHYDEVTRVSASASGFLNRSNSQGASLRATYQTPEVTLEHRLSYNRTATPENRSNSTVDFSYNVFAANSATSTETWANSTRKLRGYYYFRLPANGSMVVDWEFGYGNARLRSLRALGDVVSIANSNKEKLYSPSLKAIHYKTFLHENSLKTSLMTYNTFYHTYYDGSYDGLQKLLSSESMLFLEYTQKWPCGIRLYSRWGVSYVVGRLNGVNTLQQWNPRLGFTLQYKLNASHVSNVAFWWGNNHPTPASSNSAMVRRNELLWLQGNPALRNTIFTECTLAHNYMPSNSVTFSAAAEYHGFLKKKAFDYFSMPAHDGLVRKEVNSGDYHSFAGYVVATIRFFDNSLSLRASGQLTHIMTTGIDAQSVDAAKANVQANYFIKNFAISLFYASPLSELGPFNHGVRNFYKSTYGVAANYSHGDFKVGVQAHNWFSQGKYYSDFDSPAFSSHGWAWKAEFARRISLTLSYTLPYGKAVNRNNEVEISDETQSAILK